MRKQVCTGLLTLSLIITMAFANAIVASAAPVGDVLVAHIPFDFHVGNRLFPAGTYTLTSVTADGSGLQIRRDDGSRSIVVLTNAAESHRRTDKAAQVVFNKYGDQYFLSSAWNAKHGRTLPASGRERNLRKELRAANRDETAAQPEIVTVACFCE